MNPELEVRLNDLFDALKVAHENGIENNGVIIITAEDADHVLDAALRTAKTWERIR